VSFSDKKVAELVNTKFVAAWTNRGPGFNNTEFYTERGIVSRNYEAYPTKNICTFFLSPEGKVFYYVAGSYSPEIFVKILETASALRTTLYDDKMALKEKGMAQAKELHQSKAEAYDDLRAEAERPNGWQSLTQGFAPNNYRGKRHVHSASCSWSLKEGYEYLSALHADWSTQKALPSFDEIRYRYLYGNDFTEETGDSTHIARPEQTEKPRLIAKRIRTQLAERPKTGDVFGISSPLQAVGH